MPTRSAIIWAQAWRWEEESKLVAYWSTIPGVILAVIALLGSGGDGNRAGTSASSAEPPAGSLAAGARRERFWHIGEAHGGASFADVEQVRGSHFEDLRELEKDPRRRVSLAPLELLKVAIGDASSSHLLLCQSSPPTSPPDVVADFFEKVSEVHRESFAGGSTIIEPTG